MDLIGGRLASSQKYGICTAFSIFKFPFWVSGQKSIVGNLEPVLDWLNMQETEYLIHLTFG